jgi:small subunit ribosomal protein S9
MSTATTPQTATGRRKTAVARVWLSEGTGQIEINGRPFEDYLPTVELQNAVLAPFQAVSQINKFDVRAVVKGGGIYGQATAIRHAIARALTSFDGEYRALIKPHGFLTRDPRMKERKKSGQPGARKRFQFSKR